MSLRWVALLAVVALSLVVGFGWLARESHIQVEVAEVRQRLLTVRVATNGVVEPVEKSEVRARLSGRVVEIPDPGTRVAAGGLLLKIDAAPTAALLAAAESERLIALDSLREARDKLRRTLVRVEHDRRLFAQGALTQERLDESLADLKEGEARVDFLREEVPLRVSSLDLRIQELRAERDGAEVRAGFDGIVYKTDARRGQRVRSGDAIVWFADLDRLRVRTNVDQVDLGRVRVGQEVRVTSNAYPERVWLARIEELIPNVVRKQSRYVAEALASIDPTAAGLLPGMSVDVEIAIEAIPDALQIPSEALFTDERGTFVYRVTDGRVQVTRVEVGRSTVDSVEIAAGLAVRDRVVVSPVAGLRDGEPVDAGLPAVAGARDDG